MSSQPLKSPQQEKFAQCLAKGMTQADAYREAYPTSKKWKDKSVWDNAHKLSTDAGVIQRVSALKLPAIKAMEISIEKIMRENAWLAFSDVRMLFDADGHIKPTEQWPDELAHAVQSIEVQEIGGGDSPAVVVKKVKFWDKGSALDRLFKHAGLYAKDNEQKMSSVTKMLEEIVTIGRNGITPPRKSITVENGD